MQVILPSPGELRIALHCTEDITRDIIEVALRDIVLFDRKQRDYGMNNISAFGEIGVIVRAQDKLARVRNLNKAFNPNAQVNNEAIEDSWADLSVYGMIARLCRAGKWPGSPEQT